jgi:hypothetical protein
MDNRIITGDQNIAACFNDYTVENFSALSLLLYFDLFINIMPHIGF